MASLSMKSVRKSYGAVEVIKGVDLDIADGEFVVFVGPSGCGKSTLLRMVAGLEEITAGTMEIGGRVVNNLEPKDRGIAMVFQSYALYPHKTVYDNMAFGLHIAKAPKAEVDAKVKKAAEILKLEPYLDRLPKQLSGGQRQRVAIGRAIVRNPEVFLFDEPLSNLDAALRVNTRAEIAKLHRDLGATMIYVTHDQVEAMTLADKIVVLEGGYAQQIGTPMELYHTPANLFVAGFIGSPKMNYIEVTVAGVSADGVKVAAPDIGEALLPIDPGKAAVGDRATLGIRPEDMRHGKTDGITVNGRVELVERLGHETLVEITTNNGLDLKGIIDGTTLISLGETTDLSFAAASCHLFDSTGKALTRREVPEVVRARRGT
ncbi:ABC transporter ATP-binding protein [Pleomorphomonas sp. JP5]|uniref:ABC transporter ATP-binding protein n=1 Tax=Pleomorphomonas sp. JP5 TaxID=2942998 RepID=UPI00211EB47B|nr:sn-glycerol-3-phosphate ABC transporter ATP-binding protein UgpC [Pleomorphomonas sp. JP5]